MENNVSLQVTADAKLFPDDKLLQQSRFTLLQNTPIIEADIIDCINCSEDDLYWKANETKNLLHSNRHLLLHKINRYWCIQIKKPKICYPEL